MTHSTPLPTFEEIGQQYILIVEDSPVDLEIISRSFRRVEFSPITHHCMDGDEALAFLSICSQHQDRLPLLVLLDLNMPGTGGREVLAHMKADKTLSKIPVIILSNSNNESDISYCFSVGADKYLRKPVSSEEFSVTADVIKKFWETQILPHGLAYN